jgi:hypothetical protein
MTAIKTKNKYSTIDFTNQEISKSSLEKTLKRTKLRSVTRNEDSVSVTLFFVMIKVGIFEIHLNIHDFVGYEFNKDLALPRAKNFNISIYETNGDFPINLERSNVFKNQDWVSLNTQSNLSIEGVIDAILYCKRISNIKSFL